MLALTPQRKSGNGSMKVVVTSKNPVKVKATQSAFEYAFEGASMELVSQEAESGVASQPMTDEETLQGAINRVHNARQSQPDADYWVGLEGGVTLNEEQGEAFAWMVVLNNQGQISRSRTVSFPLAPKVIALMKQGLELGQANDQLFNTHNSKQKGGAFGLLTQGRQTRESVYTQALELALLPFSHPLYLQD